MEQSIELQVAPEKNMIEEQIRKDLIFDYSLSTFLKFSKMVNKADIKELLQTRL